MGDAAANLRKMLSKTDMSQPGIQGSAAAMMKMYDKAAPLAVSEWRSALQTCRPDQLLPLLYVANEVLQTSKRNRGPKFLEAFAEVLGSSLRFICERDRTIVEKVRRTAKIWGDRQVYSTRFVGQILGGLEDLRNGSGGSNRSLGSTTPPPSSVTAPSSTAAATGGAAAGGEKKRSVTDDEDDSSPSAAAKKKSADDDEDDAFSSPFGSSGGQALLSIDISASAAAAGTTGGVGGGAGGTKRRRSSRSSSPVPGGGGSSSQKSGAGSKTKPAKKKKLVKSTSALVSLLESLASLDDRYRSSRCTLDSIDEAHLDDTDGSLADVVGDELIDLNSGAKAAERTLKRQERVLHSIATEKRRLEGEVTGYIPWLRAALKADEEELLFCDKLEKSLESINVVHADAKKAREKRRDEEAKQKAQEEAERKMREEEEERKRSLEEAMKAPDQEAKPDMKWNPVLREYQYVGDVTEESWRD